MSNSPVVIIYGNDGYGNFEEKGKFHPFTIDGYGKPGIPKGGVVSVQGVAGGTSLPVTVTQSPGSNVNVVVNSGNIDAYQAGVWSTRTQDGYGNILTSTVAGAKRGLDENVSGWFGSTAPTVGQKTSDDSLPVVLASDQTVSVSIDAYSTTIPVNVVGSIETSENVHDGYGNIITSTVEGAKRGLDVTPFQSDASKLNATVLQGDSGTPWTVKLDGYSVTLPVKVTGTSTITGSVDASQSGDWSTKTLDGYGNKLTSTIIGAQRALDENVSGWFGSTAPTVGQKTSDDSLPVTFASDQSTLSVKLDGYSVELPVKAVTSSTSGITSVPCSASSVTLLSTNTERLGAIIVNDTSSILYVAFAPSASSSDYTYKVFSQNSLEIPFNYVGVISGVWQSSVSGSAHITELTK